MKTRDFEQDVLLALNLISDNYLALAENPITFPLKAAPPEQAKYWEEVIEEAQKRRAC